MQKATRETTTTAKDDAGARSNGSPTPSTAELLVLGAPITLRDGSRVRVRQGHEADREMLLRGFERLSDESRYRRFLAPMPALNEETVRYLTEIDHHDHEAIIAVDEATGDGIGVARYVRSEDRPDVAEVAVTVIDDWQRRGLGGLLLEVIGERARAEGITRFTAMMLATNERMLKLLRRTGSVRVVDREAGTVEVEVPIPPAGLSPAIRKLLRIAARHGAAAPMQPRSSLRLASGRGAS
jgi:GNAT superfamily N-acetyltransferase